MKKLTLLIILTIPGWLYAQQIADTTYNPVILHPAYGPGEGSVVFIDEGHHNFHTKNGRYKPFSNLLERDGYIIREYKGLFSQDKLAKGQILVISNALNETTVNDWFLPTPSAFTKTEMEAVKNWVYSGGSLFLIADHMPLAGAAEDLAAEFEFEFTNGFVIEDKSNLPALFNLKEKTLIESVITRGRNPTESVEQIATFIGQAFKIPDDATPILIFDETYINILPDTAWVFDDETTKYRVNGWSQGAYKKFGEGRIVVFGEAAMFSAQLAGAEKFKMGMNNEAAPENYQLLLNIIHWLDGMLD